MNQSKMKTFFVVFGFFLQQNESCCHYIPFYPSICIHMS